MEYVQRTDLRVEVTSSLTLAVREVICLDAGERASSIVLVHGARAGGIASFDLPVEGGSLAADLARAGHRVFVMDARGYGGSSRPAEMQRPASESSPLVRSVEVVHDIAAVVGWARERTGRDRVALLGWATGGHWVGYYASLFPERVDRLVLYNALYGGTTDHPSLGRGSNLEDPDHPGRFNRAAIGGWRESSGTSLLGTWDASIPIDEPDHWRDPAVADAYVRTALRAATGGDTATSFIHPAGALEDSFYLACGRQLWDASFVHAHTLVIRSENDFWSRPEDVEQLAEHLIDAASVRTVTLPNATHFVHLDRPERGRDTFLEHVLTFLRETA